MATQHELPEWEAPPPTPNKTSVFNSLFVTPSSHKKPSAASKISPSATNYSKEQEQPQTQPSRVLFFGKQNFLSIPGTTKKVSGYSTQSPLTTSYVDEEAFGENTTTAKRTFSDRWISHWAAFIGHSRRILVCSIVALVLLIAIVIGLAVGLSQHKGKSAKNLPLPSNAGIFTGDLTYYSPGPGYGACGFENTSSDSICAVSHIIWDAASTSSNPNNNPLCGKRIRITRYDSTVGSNRSVDVEVVDRCVGCAATDLDLSLMMFDSLAEEAQGRVVGSWAWLT